MKRLLATIISYFFRGILITVPAAVTIYVVFKLFQIIDSLFVGNLDQIYPILGEIPGLGILTLFIVITLLGLLGSSILAQPLIGYLGGILEKVPLIKTIYDAIKDLLSAFVGSEKRFDQPVLVRLSKSSDIQKLGFITKNDLSDLGIGKEKVAVYLPHSYAWSGNLYIVPRENVKPLDAKAADVMKFIVSGGVSDVDPENGEQPEKKD